MKPALETSAQVTEAIATAIADYLKGKGDFALDLKEINLRIYLKGPEWKGVVDTPVAEFLLALNGRLREELAKLGLELPAFERGLVAFKVEEGSWDNFIQWVPEAAEYITAMTAAQRVTAVAVLMASVGAWNVLKSKLRRDDLDPQEAQQMEDNSVVLDQFEQIDEDQGRLQKPLKDFLTETTSPADLIAMPGDAALESVEKAVKEIPKAKRKPRAPKVQGPLLYVDAPYIIETLHSPRDKPWSVNLRFGTATFNAKLELVEADMKELLKKYEHGKESGEVVADLQVSARFEPEDKIKGAFVAGIGDPRPNSIKLSDALARGNALKAAETATQS